MWTVIRAAECDRQDPDLNAWSHVVAIVSEIAAQHLVGPSDPRYAAGLVPARPTQMSGPSELGRHSDIDSHDAPTRTAATGNRLTIDSMRSFRGLGSSHTGIRVRRWPRVADPSADNSFSIPAPRCNSRGRIVHRRPSRVLIEVLAEYSGKVGKLAAERL
jgi:hypothetical protein